MTARTSTDGRFQAAPANPPSFSSRVQVDVSALSHQGYQRTSNEDHFLVAKLSRSLQTLMTSLPAGHVPDIAEEVNYVMIVADGMGGHVAGEVASRMAIADLIGLALELPDWILRMDDAHAEEIERRGRSRIRAVGEMLLERGRRDPALHGMGTTLTIARSLGRDLVITHVGDSRAYLLRGRRLHRLTRDHTYAQLLVDAGQLAPGDVASSRHRHVLTNALGASCEDVEVDIDRLPLEDGDRVLLCSDGLTDLADDETLASILLEAPKSSDACARLVQRALDNGGRDNVTAIVAAYQIPAVPERS